MPVIQSVAKKKKGGPQSFPQAPTSELQRVRLFRDIPHHALLLLEGGIRKASAEADETILELTEAGDELFRYFFFIVKGQVKIVGLDDEGHSRPLNFLRKGEFFVDKAVSWRGQVATKVVAITTVELLILPREELRNLAQQYPPFHARLKTLSDRIDYRNRIYSEDKYARSVMEFLIDTGLTQASRVKITQMDKCIECNTCYQSCEDRHGYQRLERGYAHFGILDFAKSCLTCFYPTCIPACPVDSVVFNVQKGEVEILDSCIGCSACSAACQYGAIKMYKVLEGDQRFDRFLAPDKKIKPKFVADKCNHCEGYEDMACITHCPTGAIIEVEASDLLENPRIFGAGEGVRKPLPSKIESPWLERALEKFYIAIGVLIVLGFSWEAYILTRWPGLSVLLSLQRRGWIPANFEISFVRASNLNIFLGVAGFALILVSMLYPLRKVFPQLFKYLGKKPIWLHLHNFCGLIATFFILLHTGFYFPMQPSTFGFIALVIVTISGIFGQFLYMSIPRSVAGTELKIQDIQEEDATITKKLDAIFQGTVEYRETVNRLVSTLIKGAAQKPSIWTLANSMFQTRLLLWKMRFNPPPELGKRSKQLGVILQLIHEKIRLERNVAFLEYSSRLFIQWKYIHRPFAYIMSAIVLGHIIYNLRYFTGWK